jgi:hypothetical protein
MSRLPTYYAPGSVWSSDFDADLPNCEDYGPVPDRP